MRVVEIESQRYTAYIPEGLLDRIALRFIPGLTRVVIPVLALRDLVAGSGDGYCLVRLWSGTAPLCEHCSKPRKKEEVRA